MKYGSLELFDAVLDGRDVSIEFTRLTTFVRSHYGADADGNRGVDVTEIEEDEAEGIVVLTVEDGADGHKELTTPLDALTSLQALEVQRLVDEYLAAHVPDEPEPDDEDDYDHEDS